MTDRELAPARPSAQRPLTPGARNTRSRPRRPRLPRRLAALASLAVVGLVVPLAALGAPAAAEVEVEQLTDSTFTDGPGDWWGTEDLTPDTSTGAFCVDVAGDTANPWSSIVGYDGITVERGESYRLLFDVSGTTEATIRVLVQLGRSPWTAVYELNPVLTPDARSYEVGFTSAMDIEEGQIVFQIGAAKEDWTFCVDNISFGIGEPMPPYQAETYSDVRVNQVGYLPDGPKRATLISEETQPQTWVLHDAAGVEVATGTTTPQGEDRTAALSTHLIDLSAVTATGTGFVLSVGDQHSHPFAISADIYDALPFDALSYFYLVRSGIEIDAALVGEAYARPAGHLDVAPNQGDSAVGCQAPQPWNNGWTCDYTLDVTGGWYDAGDHGKYVVNGGIAVYQLLDIAEREGLADPATAADGRFGAGTLAIPEAGNETPDLLAEARWELEWMLKMQVPDGLPLAGMVHHKVQDDAWTGLPVMPHLDPQARQLHRPSTAATLNLAAVAAKGSRLLRAYDADFADELLVAAERAWVAAEENETLYAVAADGNTGGGPYNDDDVTDERYWAAAELWLTTGEAEFADAVLASESAAKPLPTPKVVDWAETAALAHIDLARAHVASGEDGSVPGGAQALAAIVEVADALLAMQQSQHFGQPYVRGDFKYEWGSSSIVVNNAAVLATAADLTGDTAYRDGALEALDYVLGRNAIDRSYVTGYGANYSENQHSRWMAPQLDPTLPHPPAGTLAGGANSAIQDPVAARTWPDGCPGQLCYLDDIQSWSTNEMTVNWNSAMAWLAAWSSAEAHGGLTVDDGAASPAWHTWFAWLVAAGAVGALSVASLRTPDRGTRGD